MNIFEFVKKYIKKYWWLILLIVVIIPSAIYLLSSVPLLPPGGNNDWAGFWGGYIGSVLGGVITLFVLWKTLSEEKRAREREEKICYFNSIIHLWSGLERNINDLFTCVYRCEKDKTNDSTEKVYREKSASIGSLIEIETMLITRKNIYDIDDMLNKLSMLYDNLKIFMDKFKDAGKVAFKFQKHNDEMHEIIKILKSDISEMEECIKNTVSNNLL